MKENRENTALVERSILRRVGVSFLCQAYLNNILFPTVLNTVRTIDPEAVQALMNFWENTLLLGPKLPAYMPAAAFVLLSGVATGIEMGIRVCVSRGPRTKAWSEHEDKFQTSMPVSDKEPVVSPVHLLLNMNPSSIREAICMLLVSLALQTANGVMLTEGATTVFNTLMQDSFLNLALPVLGGRILSGLVEAMSYCTWFRKSDQKKAAVVAEEPLDEDHLEEGVVIAEDQQPLLVASELHIPKSDENSQGRCTLL